MLGKNPCFFSSLTVMEPLYELNPLGTSVVKYCCVTNKYLKFYLGISSEIIMHSDTLILILVCSQAILAR